MLAVVRATYLSLPQQSNYASKVRVEIADLNRTKPWEMVSEHISPVFYEGLAQPSPAASKLSYSITVVALQVSYSARHVRRF